MKDDYWAVLVSSSKYFYNYRHFGNVLAFYSFLKARGYRDDQIILMDSLNPACDYRNQAFGSIFSLYNQSRINLYNNVEIDYKGDEVSSTNFLKLLTGNTPSGELISRKLQSHSQSTVVIYLSGHGGDEFFKFRDNDELSALELGLAISVMYECGMYKRLLVIAETCQAITLSKYISSPNVLFVSSSRRGENSFAYTFDDILQVSLLDRFSLVFLEGLIKACSELDNNAARNKIDRLGDVKRKRMSISKGKTIEYVVQALDNRFLGSHADVVSFGPSSDDQFHYIIDYFPLVVASANKVSERNTLSSEIIKTKWRDVELSHSSFIKPIIDGKNAKTHLQISKSYEVTRTVILMILIAIIIQFIKFKSK